MLESYHGLERAKKALWKNVRSKLKSAKLRYFSTRRSTSVSLTIMYYACGSLEIWWIINERPSEKRLFLRKMISGPKTGGEPATFWWPVRPCNHWATVTADGELRSNATGYVTVGNFTRQLPRASLLCQRRPSSGCTIIVVYIGRSIFVRVVCLSGDWIAYQRINPFMCPHQPKLNFINRLANYSLVSYGSNISSVFQSMDSTVHSYGHIHRVGRTCFEQGTPDELSELRLHISESRVERTKGSDVRENEKYGMDDYLRIPNNWSRWVLTSALISIYIYRYMPRHKSCFFKFVYK